MKLNYQTFDISFTFLTHTKINLSVCRPEGPFFQPQSDFFPLALTAVCYRCNLEIKLSFLFFLPSGNKNLVDNLVDAQGKPKPDDTVSLYLACKATFSENLSLSLRKRAWQKMYRLKECQHEWSTLLCVDLIFSTGFSSYIFCIYGYFCGCWGKMNMLLCLF